MEFEIMPHFGFYVTGTKSIYVAFFKGVINFLPSPASMFGKTVTSSPDLAGLTFVGSGP